MRCIALLASVVGIAAPMLAAAPANAQATRTWVSGVGDDANPCSRTAPCKTFAGAISKTAANGEINCLDPGGFGGVTITKSITIDCHEIQAGVLVSGTNAIVINGSGIVVTLRNLNVNGLTTGLKGISILTAAVVSLEDMLIQEFTQQGINDGRTVAGGELYIRNSIIQNNTLTGIAQASTQTVKTVIQNVRSTNNGIGIASGSPNNVMVFNSNISGNTNAGVQADPGSQISVDSTVMMGNGTGVVSNSNVRLSNTDIAFNTTGITGASLSFGNNRIAGNAAPGTAPTPIGAATQFLGTQ